MSQITHYELRHEGYIAQDGTEHYDTAVFEADTKEACVQYVTMNSLYPAEYFVNTIGYEYIHGVKVPCVINEEPEYIEKIIGTQVKKIICRISGYQDYTNNRDLDNDFHKGFTIGKGKVLYWMMVWHSSSGNVTVYSAENATPRYISGDTKITIHFK